MKLITAELINELAIKAAASPRRRSHYNIHESPSDAIQRLFVASMKDSYFRPHRHPGKWEFATVISGSFDIIVFDDSGRVTERHSIGEGTGITAFEMPADTWHAWIPLSDGSAFLEFKQGPYDAKTSSEFATWSVAEGTPEAPAFAAKLRSAKTGTTVE